MSITQVRDKQTTTTTQKLILRTKGDCQSGIDRMYEEEGQPRLRGGSGDTHTTASSTPRQKDSEVVLVVSSTTELSTSIPSGPSTNYQVQWINNCWSGHGVPQAQELFGDGQVR